MKNTISKRKPNKKVIAYSVFGIVCLALAFFINWLFILGSAIAIYVNQKELMNN